MTVDEIITEIVKREGGLVDNPADKGGITNYGISLRYARGIGLDLNGDCHTDKDDIVLVTPQIAHDLYLRDFYYIPKIDGLPEPLQPFMVDFAINSGPGRAVMTLQALLGAMTNDTTLVQDGVIGPKTRAVAERLCDAMRPLLVNQLVEARNRYLQWLVHRDPSQARFLSGWLARSNSFREAVH